MQRRLLLVLALLAAGCREAPESDLKLLTIESPATIGLSLRELPPSVLKSVGLPYGLVVVRADGVAGKAGLRMGDVVYGVNEQRLHSIDDWRAGMRRNESSAVRLLVRRGKSDFYVSMDVGGMLPRPEERKAPGSRDTLLRT
jgi:C-terminal processing protease CtpA/Prc